MKQKKYMETDFLPAANKIFREQKKEKTYHSLYEIVCCVVIQYHLIARCTMLKFHLVGNFNLKINEYWK